MVRQKGIYNVFKISKISQEKIPSGPATFEEAIAATGFGKFNLILMLMGSFPITWAIMIALTNISQIIPSLKCDFNLNLKQIGMLNASPFVGNIISPLLWGFIADKYGRRKLIICATLADGIFNIINAFSTSAEMLIMFKFLSGFVITAPTGIILSYLSECHSSKYRSKMIMAAGIQMGTVNIILPLLAWAILPRNFYFFHSWQIYLLATSIPSLVGGTTFIFIPETPKFYMSAGRHDEALKVFQKIFALNTGKPENTYPITELLCDNKNAQERATEKQNTIYQTINNSWQQFKPLFHKPYLHRLILSVWLEGCLMMGVNTLRVWLPELFTLMDNYNTNSNASFPTLCEIMQHSINQTNAEEFSNVTISEKSCNEVQSRSDVYIKLIIIGCISVTFYIIITSTSSIINEKVILASSVIISGSSGIALIWLKNPIIILLIAASYTTQTGMALLTLLSILVDLFPTSFRTTTVLMCSTAGRITSVLGNIILPILFISGCAPAFIFLGVAVLSCLIPLILLSSIKAENT